MNKIKEKLLKKLAVTSSEMSQAQIYKHWLEWVDQALDEYDKEIREQDIKAFENLIGEEDHPSGNEGDAMKGVLTLGPYLAPIMSSRARNQLRAELRTKLDQYKKKI